MFCSHRGEDPLWASAQRDACAVLMSWPRPSFLHKGPGISSWANTMVIHQRDWPPRPPEQCCYLFQQFTRSIFGGNVTDETLLSAFKILFRHNPTPVSRGPLFKVRKSNFYVRIWARGRHEEPRSGPAVRRPHEVQPRRQRASPAT